MHDLDLSRETEELVNNKQLCQLCVTGKLLIDQAEVVMTEISVLHNETDVPHYEGFFEFMLNDEPVKRPSFIGTPIQIYKAAFEEFLLISSQMRV